MGTCLIKALFLERRQEFLASVSSILERSLYVPFTYVVVFGCFPPTGELPLQGPVFIREPSDSVVPIGPRDKRVTLNCEARGNPSPHYRYSGKFENSNGEKSDVSVVNLFCAHKCRPSGGSSA